MTGWFWLQDVDPVEFYEALLLEGIKAEELLGAEGGRPGALHGLELGSMVRPGIATGGVDKSYVHKNVDFCQRFTFGTFRTFGTFGTFENACFCKP